MMAYQRNELWKLQHVLGDILLLHLIIFSLKNTSVWFARHFSSSFWVCSLPISAGLLVPCLELIYLILICQTNHISQYLTIPRQET